MGVLEQPPDYGQAVVYGHTRTGLDWTVQTIPAEAPGITVPGCPAAATTRINSMRLGKRAYGHLIMAHSICPGHRRNEFAEWLAYTDKYPPLPGNWHVYGTAAWGMCHTNTRVLDGVAHANPMAFKHLSALMLRAWNAWGGHQFHLPPGSRAVDRLKGPT